MSNYELEKVELPAIAQLQSLGWTYIEGKKLSPDESDERQSYKDTVLKKRLSAALKKINPWISEDNLRHVMRELTKFTNDALIESNEKCFNNLRQYMSIEQDLGEGRRSHTVKIIDFDNIEKNEFLVTNQFKVAGINENIIPDIILFVNGLPLAVIECKSPYITNPMEAGIKQLLRYCNNRNPEENEGAERLFHYNQVLVSTHFKEARLATISANYEHYLEWKDVYPNNIKNFSNKSSQEVMIEGVFNQTNFLDIVRNFIVFDLDEGKTIKKVTRYQQYRAVHKTLERIKKGETKKDQGGVIWHTQGSGKSLTMVFLAQKIRRDEELKKYKLIYLTDRTQLDSQLTTTLAVAQDETVLSADLEHLY
jgi:type I restriction enzyme, R subunit